MRSGSRYRRRWLLIVCVAALVLSFVGILLASQRVEDVTYQPKAVAAPDIRRPFAVFIGDSYTAGTGATSISARFVTLVSHQEGWAFQNLGQGGTGYVTTASIGVRACGSSSCPPYGAMVSRIKALKPDIVVISGGRNDLSAPHPRIREDVLKFYTSLRSAAPKAKIYATSPIWADTDAPPRLLDLGKNVRNAVSSIQGTYLDIGEPLHNHPEFVTGDRVHPNDAGHGAIAQAIEKAIAASA